MFQYVLYCRVFYPQRGSTTRGWGSVRKKEPCVRTKTACIEYSQRFIVVRRDTVVVLGLLSPLFRFNFLDFYKVIEQWRTVVRRSSRFTNTYRKRNSRVADYHLSGIHARVRSPWQQAGGRPSHSRDAGWQHDLINWVEPCTTHDAFTTTCAIL